MRVLVTGSAGMLGRKLTTRLLEIGSVAGRELTALDLADVVATPTSDERQHSLVGDLAEPSVAADLVARRPDLVFHLAGVVSGEAEADLAKGYRVNLDGTRNLFDALAMAPGTPRVVFTSSIAVFGAPFPDIIDDNFHLTPLTSYGTQKAMAEALLADYTRRGLIDGVGIRLPTITVRPGKPNAAASGFFSSIIREPLAGVEAVLPVDPSIRHVHASPQAAIGFLMHSASLDPSALGSRPNLTMPSVSVTVAEQIAALAEVAGPEVTELIIERPDPTVSTIIEGWPRRFATERADALGFRAETSYEQIIRSYLDHDAGAGSRP
ncbi:MAG: SDR family oxidoreductase [Actinomycetia bacterium]|nr:SDR family oxidoreductase [Actinomycetes bacterium]MCP5033863.1 SDR family oxidoreductase [Actinomycetes bacterium]